MANGMNRSPSSITYNHSNGGKEDKKGDMTSRTTYSSTLQGTAVKRIRTPHPHDVLSGRGGGINSHEGNIQFRSWVALRKNDYNLAASKTEKARVAREVIAFVESQNPPGKFLQKDPTSIGAQAFWIEVDDEKKMAKTSQALREGAPQIRAAHMEEIKERSSTKTNRRSAKRKLEPRLGYVAPTEPSTLLDKPMVVAQLQANMAAARDAAESVRDERPNKRVRVEYNGHTLLPTDATPPLLPSVSSASKVEPLNLSILPAMPAGRGLSRSHSLALSDISFGDLEEDFVNPFEYEGKLETSSSVSSPAPQPGVLRENSLSSDMGGYGALFKEPAAQSSAVRSFSKAISSSTSSRSLSSILSDLPDVAAETEFTEGVKSIFEATYPDNEEEANLSHLIPFWGNDPRPTFIKVERQ